MKRIIQPFFGGMGDSLEHSHLPRRFSEQGDEVYLSSRAQFRNTQIKKLVWDMNPFIKGLSDDEPNAGDAAVSYRNDGLGFMSNWESVHGLKPETKYPEVYYRPKTLSSLQDKTLVDLSCVSLSPDYNKDQLLEIAKSYPNYMSMLFVSNISDGHFDLNDNLNGYVIHNIFDYCDAIYSCKKFVCLFAGGNALASALQRTKKIDVDCLIVDCPKTQSALKQDLFFFDNINYIWI